MVHTPSVRGGRVILKAVVALNRQVPGSDVQDDVSKPTAIVLISERHKSFEVFLQVRSIVLDRLVLAPRIRFGVIALHFFSRAIVAVAVEVHGHKRNSRSGQSVAFRQDSGFGRSLSWLKGLVIGLLSVFHALIPPIY